MYITNNLTTHILRRKGRCYMSRLCRKSKKARTLAMLMGITVASASISFSGFTLQSNGNVSTKETTISAATQNYGLVDNVQDGVILHCWNWSYNNIKSNMKLIAQSGYSAIQTSPVTQPKDYSYKGETELNVGIPDGCGGSEGQWWKLYQPVSMNICDNGQSFLGTKSEFKAMCEEAEKYGVKVIVDIVANHMANITGWKNKLSDVSEQVGAYCNPDMLTDPTYWHINDTQCWFSDGRYDITQGTIGMPDLNTADKRVQNMVLGLLKECVDCGADGFRFDAAKHIETPADGAFGSDFWPTVINGIRNYADHDLFIYGEILNTVGDNFDISNYTKYMSVTDNGTGDQILSTFRYKNAGSAASGNARYEAKKTVLWAESHDTYMGGPSYLATDKMVKGTWSVVAAKKDSTALYFARPYYSNQILKDEYGDKYQKSQVTPTNMGDVGTMTWADPEVAAVNRFHNAFVGQDQCVSSSGNVVYTERGNSGVIIANMDGAGYVDIQANRMADGIYTDEVSGETFTVSGGRIRGNIKSSDGIAVVYNKTLKPTVSPTTTPAVTPTTQPTTQPSIQPTVTPSETPVTDNIIYMKNEAGWSDVYCYMWNSSSDTNGSWPGTKMTYMGDNVWTYKAAKDFQNVIFTNGSGTQTGDMTSPGNGYIYNNKTGSWSKYSNTSTETPSTNYKVYCKNTSGWSQVYCYMWNSSNDTIGSWPGVAMTYEGDNIWSVEVSKDYANVIFTNGSGFQTADLTYPGKGNVYNTGTNSWLPL